MGRKLFVNDSVRFQAVIGPAKAHPGRYLHNNWHLPLWLKVFLCILALIILGGTNDTLLAEYQYIFIGAFVAGSALYALVSPRKFGKLEKAVLLLAFVACITAVPELVASAEKSFTIRMGLYFLVYFLCMMCYAKIKVYACLYRCIRVCAVLLAGTIILSATLKGTFIGAFSFWLTNDARVLKDVQYGQFSGLIGDRSFAAIAMCIGVYAELAIAFARGRLTKRNLFSIAICLIGMLLTGKRITIIMLMGGVVAVLLLTNNQKMRKAIIGTLLAIAAMTVVALVVFPQTQVAVYRIIEGLSDTTFNDRIHFWVVAWEMFSQKPLFGWGIGSYLRYNSLFGDGVRQYAHNMYFQLLAERGIVGTAIILLMFISAFVMTFQTIRMRKGTENGGDRGRLGNEAYVLSLFSLMSQMGFLVYGLTGYPIYNLHQGFFYAICIGMMMNIRAEMRQGNQ